MAADKISPIHPGEMILKDVLEPLGMSQNQLARALKVSPRRINEIVLGKRRITADTALRLAKYLGTSAQFWMKLQARYDLDVAEDAVGEKIEKEIDPLEKEKAA